MFSKRKFEETDTENVKKMKRDFSLYIEREREKMILEESSAESIQNYVSEFLRSAETFICSYEYDFFPETYTAPNRNIISSSFSSSLPLDLNLLIRRPVADSQGTDQSSSQHNQTGATQSSDMKPDLTGSLLDNETLMAIYSSCGGKISRHASLMTQLIDMRREWKLVAYQNLMDEYNLLRDKNPDFWDAMILRSLPHAMLVHHVKANIVADFFHIMCRDLRSINAVVKIKPSYLQFFLMNMAAVNRIECSLVLETDQWNSAKSGLVERAFVAGRVSNLKLLLQYFQPADLWSSTDMKFLKASNMGRVRRVLGLLQTLYDASEDAASLNPDLHNERNSEVRANNMDLVASGYANNLTLLNLVRVANYVSESQAPKEVLGDCIRLFWRASETPYVSLADIEDAFKPLNQSLLLRHTLMRSFKNQLLEAYPMECLADYQPRSLKHLCRCKIRQSMTSVVFLPSLPLPTSLKRYLNLDM